MRSKHVEIKKKNDWEDRWETLRRKETVGTSIKNKG
jgi:hypothetical protein